MRALTIRRVKTILTSKTSKFEGNKKIPLIQKVSLKSIIRNLSKKFTKQHVLSSKRKPLLSDPPIIKQIQTSYIKKKLITNYQPHQKAYPGKILYNTKVNLISKYLLPHDANIQSIRKKYHLSINRRTQRNFMYGFNIKNYSSISRITFENYIKAMETFYTVFTYKISVKHDSGNKYLLKFNYLNDIDAANVYQALINVTYLNIFTGSCDQKYYHVKRDENSFIIIKEPNNICLFELFQQGMNENENYGKGFCIF